MTRPQHGDLQRTPAVLSELDAESIAWALLRDGGDSGDLDILAEASQPIMSGFCFGVTGSTSSGPSDADRTGSSSASIARVGRQVRPRN